MKKNNCEFLYRDSGFGHIVVLLGNIIFVIILDRHFVLFSQKITQLKSYGYYHTNCVHWELFLLSKTWQ